MSPSKRKKSTASDVEEAASLSPTTIATPHKKIKTEGTEPSSPNSSPKVTPNAKTSPSIVHHSPSDAVADLVGNGNAVVESSLLAGSPIDSPTGSVAADAPEAENDNNPDAGTLKTSSPSKVMTQTSNVPTSEPSPKANTPTSSKKPTPQAKSRKRKQSHRKDSAYVYSGDETDEPLTKSQKQQQHQPRHRRRSSEKAYRPPPETPTTATTTTGADFNANVADEDGQPHGAFDDEAAPDGFAREVNLSVLERAAAARKYERERRRSTELVGLRSQEYRLFETIDHRGFEPFLPVSWHLDFPFKVDAYFGESFEESHINSTDFADSNANFRAIRALQTLLKMGPKARDRLEIMGLRPEQSMAKQVREYIAWSERDAGLSTGGPRNAPRLLSMAFDDDEEGGDATRVIQALKRKMRRSASEWRIWQRERGLVVAPRPEEREFAEREVEGKEEGGEIDFTDINRPTNESSHREDISHISQEAEENKKTLHEIKQARKRRRSSFIPGVLRWVQGVFSRRSSSLTPSTPTLLKTNKHSDHSASRSRNNNSNKSKYAVEAVYGIAISHLVIAILTLHIDDDVDYENGADEAQPGADDDDDGNQDEHQKGHDNENNDIADPNSDSDSDPHFHSATTEASNSETSPHPNNGMVTSQHLSGKEEEESSPRNSSDRRSTRVSGSRSRSPSSSRVLFYVDFAKAGEDVWNAVAVAMAVCHCRDLRVQHSDVVESE